MEQLALLGGPKTKIKPFGTGRRFGEQERREVLEALDSDVLFYVVGTKVHGMEARMRGMYGMKHCNGCSSGTAAVHIALGSLELPPGKEVITSGITDMGTVTGILYQCLIPRFADIDPETYNMDPNAVERLINPKTGAIVVVHHAGLPAEMDEFTAIAGKHGIPLVEDCAQAWYTHYKNRLCGTFGDISTFSLNHFKLITSGSGGMVLTNRDELEEVVKLFIDKCYFRDGRKRNPYFLAPNYQMTELQGAVALGQLEKVAGIVERRNRSGMRLIRGLEAIPGIIPQRVPEYSTHSFFLLVVRIDPGLIPVEVSEFCRALEAEGIPSEPNKVTGGMPTYLYDIFRERSAFPRSSFPFVSKDLGSDISYPEGLCPNTEDAFEHTFNFNITEFYTEEDIDDMLRATEKAAQHYRTQGG
ncbi:MAG TPA: DegT/DnrJ/EryC1/StrS family aminotransferase [Spirochaetia bacterium]|nr:DegT/DnrJ/EryC1/StrS family aminotransferase [Spirochaetia bacterium]